MSTLPLGRLQGSRSRARNKVRKSLSSDEREPQYAKRAILISLRQSEKYSKNDEIPLREFSIALREPIHLHPSFRYGLREENGVTTFCFEVDLAGGFDLFQWKRQLNKFQYQYATYRTSVFDMHNSVTSSLTQNFLEGEHGGTQSEFEIPGLDSFTPSLNGLHCWDLRKREGKSLTGAIAKTAELYELSHGTMRPNYRIADKRIKEMAARFQNISKETSSSHGHLKLK